MFLSGWVLFEMHKRRRISSVKRQALIKGLIGLGKPSWSGRGWHGRSRCACGGIIGMKGSNDRNRMERMKVEKERGKGNKGRTE